MGLVLGEAAVGVLLLVNLFPAVTRRLGLALFSGFAGYLLRAVQTGQATCGCLGAIPMGPKAMLAVDLSVIGLLVWATRGTAGPWSSGQASPWLRLTLSGGVVVMFAAGYGVAMAGKGPVSGPVAIFQPGEWEGRRLPFLDEIDIGRELSRGAWRVLLYRSDCSKCQEAIWRFEGSPGDPQAQERRAMVELPPYGAALPSTWGHLPGAMCRGRLSPGSRWFISSPCQICLREGIVVAGREKGVKRKQ